MGRKPQLARETWRMLRTMEHAATYILAQAMDNSEHPELRTAWRMLWAGLGEIYIADPAVGGSDALQSLIVARALPRHRYCGRCAECWDEGRRAA
ncbi:MAG TPA: hypothetical protein VE998_10835 [Terriglobales bacterium]|nr:hypothetical protein [Terriglobales bacterium]